MATISSKRSTYLASDQYTDCRCVRIELTNGTIKRYTTHHEDLEIGGVTYYSTSGYNTTALSVTATASVDNLEVSGIYDSGGISRSDLLAGLYDGSSLFIFDTDYTDPVEDEHPKRRGFKGEVTLRDDDFTIEFRSLTSALQQTVGRTFTKLDEFDIIEGGVRVNPDEWQAATAYTLRESGDATTGSVVKPTTQNGFHYKCSVAGTSGGTEPTWPTTAGATVTDGTCEWTAYVALQLSGTVTSVTDNANFADSSLTQEDDWWGAGKITWLTGNNAGYEMEVKYSQSSGDIELFLPMVESIQVGDTFNIIAGYRRTKTESQTKLDNYYNFGGFADIPGQGNVGKFGGQ